MFWCFHCYAVNGQPGGPCDICGEPVEAPTGLSWVGSLTWALRHPDGDRALLAARTLGRLRVRESVPALCAAVESGRDVYLRAAALRSLIAIEGTRALRPWLDELSRVAPVTVREIARQALQEAADANASQPDGERRIKDAGTACLPVATRPYP
jgi:HEAT repeats